jgi:YHS domain-containing protein
MKSRLFVAGLAVFALFVVGSLRAADEEKPVLKCPVSGQPAKADKTAEFNGGTIQFCCDKCPVAFAKNPKKFAAKANLQLVQTKQLKQVKCPLTGKPCASDKGVEIAGVTVYVCCNNCLGKTKKLATENEKIELLLSDISKGFVPTKQ